MAILKKHGKTGRHKGATKAVRSKVRHDEDAHTEEEPSESDEAEVVDDDDDDDESDPLVGGVAGALIGGVAGLVIGGVLGTMADAFKSAVDDDDEDEELESEEFVFSLIFCKFPLVFSIVYLEHPSPFCGGDAPFCRV